MGTRCYTFDKNDPLKEKMIILKNNFEKVNIIGIGGSSKVKFNILISKLIIYLLIGVENNRKKYK